jgi:hypothetical protein
MSMTLMPFSGPMDQPAPRLSFRPSNGSGLGRSSAPGVWAYAPETHNRYRPGERRDPELQGVDDRAVSAAIS